MSTHTDESLLIPELLSYNRLIEILRQRCVPLKNGSWSAVSKEELINLFHKHVSPLPQRPYRDNRRGNQIKEHRLKKQPIDHKVKTETKQTTQLVASGSGNRLKPPPETKSNFERKIIKLKPTSATKNNATTVAMEVTQTISLKRKTTESTVTVNKQARHLTWP